MAVAITLYGKAASNRLQAIGQEVRNPSGLLKILGARGNKELRNHFISKISIPNKLGGRRTYWWWGVAKSVTWKLMGATEARVSVTEPGIGLKVFGGVVRPQRAKALTIPVAQEAYGRTVAVFQQETGIQLFLLRKKGGGGFSNLLAGAGANKQVKVYYVLSQAAHQDKDPTALPPVSQWQEAMLSDAESFLERAISRGQTQ